MQYLREHHYRTEIKKYPNKLPKIPGVVNYISHTTIFGHFSATVPLAQLHYTILIITSDCLFVFNKLNLLFNRYRYKNSDQILILHGAHDLSCLYAKSYFFRFTYFAYSDAIEKPNTRLYALMKQTGEFKRILLGWIVVTQI